MTESAVPNSLAHHQLASDTATTVVEVDDEDIVDYNRTGEDSIRSAHAMGTWIYYRQNEILSDAPSRLAVILCSLNNIYPDQITMDKINKYLGEYVNKKEFQNIELDPDAMKSEKDLQGFLEISVWYQRVTNTHVYSDNDHRRGIKAPPSLEIQSLLQIIQFLVEW